MSVNLPVSAFAPWPQFENVEIEAVENVLRSGKVNYWTGEEGKRFEEEFARFVGSGYAISLANGSLALELALKALNIGSGDEVIVTSRSFIASASCVALCGARPVFADVDPKSQNITAETISAVLTDRTRAIIPVHLMGWPCDMDPILELTRGRNIAVIEDCAQAHGATYKGKVVGSIGDIGVFSFCQDKIMTTGGEGGMLVTDNRQLWSRAWSYKDHGKDYDLVFNHSHPPGYRWLHKSFGTNFRMTEMQSAIGRVVLKRLPDWLAIRRRYAGILTSRFSQIDGLQVFTPEIDSHHAYYKYYVLVDSTRLKPDWDRDRIMAKINKLGIPCYNTYGGEIYRDEAFEAAGLRPPKELPVARRLGETCLQFLVHPTLSEKNMDDTCQVVTEVMYEATKQ